MTFMPRKPKKQKINFNRFKHSNSVTMFQTETREPSENADKKSNCNILILI